MKNHNMSRIFTSCQMGTYRTHTGHHRPVCIDVSACHFACPDSVPCGRFMCSLVARKCLLVKSYEHVGCDWYLLPGSPYSKICNGFWGIEIERVAKQSNNVRKQRTSPAQIKPPSYSRLDDGGETDLDLGNYERMMYLSLGRCGGAIWQVLSMPVSRSFQENTPGISRAQGQTLPFKLLNCRDNNLTTGKIYESVIKKDCSRLKCPYCCLHATIISAKAPGAWGKVLGQNSASGPTHHWCDCWVDQPWRGSIDGESRATNFGIKHRLAVEF